MIPFLIIVALTVYVIVGLFCSRWWWRRDVAPYDPSSQAMAFWIALLWPLWLVGVPIFAFVRGFYGQPVEPSDDDDEDHKSW